MGGIRRWQFGAVRFASNESGSVAILFGLAVFVLAGSIALGLDYGRALGVRSRLQQAVDAAALAAHPDGSRNNQQMTDAVNSQFAYDTKGQGYGSINVIVNSQPIEKGIVVTATADVPTSFGRLLGVPNIPVAVKAEAVSGKGNFEIALVLDTTYSMNGNKLTDLQTAAKKLVDQVVASSPSGTLKFGLVPFANYVNVGMSYRHVPWMSVANDYSEPQHSCWQTTDWDGCPTKTYTYSCTNDGVPQTCTGTTCATPAAPHQVCQDWTQYHNWNGCAGSRTPVPDLAVTASISSPVPGTMDVGCPSALLRLTTDDSAIKNGIDAMVAQGETYIPSGLMWGWRVLAPDSPFADGAAYSGASTKKIIILMTDGFNTKSQLDTNHEGSDSAAADNVLTQLCTQVKQQSIELYTIDFEVNNPAAKALMQGCATNSAHYFDASDSASLAAAFDQIAGSLIKLALSK